jgi:hypothetical protein
VKKRILFIVLGVIILAGIGTPSYLYAKEKQANKSNADLALVQSILSAISQNGGQILKDGNGNSAIYVPQKTYVTISEDKEYRHIGLWVDGILMADRQIPLQAETTPTPSVTP